MKKLNINRLDDTNTTVTENKCSLKSNEACEKALCNKWICFYYASQKFPFEQSRFFFL